MRVRAARPMCVCTAAGTCGGGRQGSSALWQPMQQLHGHCAPSGPGAGLRSTRARTWRAHIDGLSTSTLSSSSTFATSSRCSAASCPRKSACRWGVVGRKAGRARGLASCCGEACFGAARPRLGASAQRNARSAAAAHRWCRRRWPSTAAAPSAVAARPRSAGGEGGRRVVGAVGGHSRAHQRSLLSSPPCPVVRSFCGLQQR